MVTILVNQDNGEILENILDFNNLEIFLFVFTKPHIIHKNSLDITTLLEYNIISDTNTNLSIKVCLQKEDYSTTITYHPYSMRQAYCLYQQGLDMKLIETIYQFSQKEIRHGFAYLEREKCFFYPESLEINKRGKYYFHYSNTGLPEFFSSHALDNV